MQVGEVAWSMSLAALLDFVTTPVGATLSAAFDNLVDAASGARAVADAPALAGLINLELLLTAVDVPTNLVTFTMRVQPFWHSLAPGLYDPTTLTLALPSGLALRVQLFSDVSGAGQVVFKNGDKQLQRSLAMDLAVDRTLYYYPFDRYHARVRCGAARPCGHAAMRSGVLRARAL